MEAAAQVVARRDTQQTVQCIILYTLGEREGWANRCMGT
jgi:hypothetical protein